MMRGGRLKGPDGPRGREVFWDASLNLQSSPTAEGVHIHVSHSVTVEQARDTSIQVAGWRRDELKCGGDVGLPRLACAHGAA